MQSILDSVCDTKNKYLRKYNSNALTSSLMINKIKVRRWD